LEAGDEVTFKIIEADTADEPIRKEPEANPEKRRKKRYEQYKLLKREFEEMKALLLSKWEIQKKRSILKQGLCLSTRKSLRRGKVRRNRSEGDQRQQNQEKCAMRSDFTFVSMISVWPTMV
jgi:hypothetical protein